MTLEQAIARVLRDAEASRRDFERLAKRYPEAARYEQAQVVATFLKIVKPRES